MTLTAAEAAAKLAKHEANLGLFDQVVNGDDTVVVETDGGPVPSLAKTMAEMGWDATLTGYRNDALEAAEQTALDAAAALEAKADAQAAQAATESLQSLLIALANGLGKPFASTYATTLPRGVTSVTIGGTAITGATVGEYPISGTGGSITGYGLTLVVTSATAAFVRINTNPDGSLRTGLGSGTTPPTLTVPAGATLPVGVTLTAVVSPIIPDQFTYAAALPDSTGFLICRNNGGSFAKLTFPNGADMAFSSQAQLLTLMARVSPYGNVAHIASSPVWLRCRPNIIKTDGTPVTGWYVYDARRDTSTRAVFEMRRSSDNVRMCGFNTNAAQVNPTTQPGHNGGVGDIEIGSLWFSADALAEGVSVAASTVMWDYGSGDLWTAGPTFQSGTAATTWISGSKQGLSSAQQAQVNLLAGVQSGVALRRSGTFASTVTDNRLLDWIIGAEIEQREPGESNPVEISEWSKFGTSFSFKFRDPVTGTQVAQGGITSGSAIDYATIAELKCREGSAGAGGFTGRYVTLRFDPTRAPSGSVALQTLSAGQGRFASTCVKSQEQQLAVFDQQLVAQRVYFAGNWSGMDAAVRSLHATQQTFANNENFFANVTTNKATSHRRVELFCEVRGSTITVPKMTGTNGGLPITVGSITLPEWVDLNLNGSTLYSSDNARIIDDNFSGAIRGGTIFCDPPVINEPDVTNYGDHLDTPDGRTKLPAVGDTRFQQQKFLVSRDDVIWIGGVNHRNWLHAVGTQSGSVYKYRRCAAFRRNRTNGQPAFGYHTAPNTTEPAYVEHIGTRGDQMQGPLMEFATGHLVTCGRTEVALIGCDPFAVKFTCSMGLAYTLMPDEWALRRSYELTSDHGGVIITEDPGALGLMVDPNATVSGNFFTLLGGRDEYGRLPKLVLDGTAANRGLPQRLLGQGAVTITVNGLSHVFNVTSTSGLTSAGLVAAANASLGANVLQLVRMDRMDATGPGLRRVFSSTGTTISAGTALRRLGFDDVRICGTDERPDGFALTPIVGGTANTGGMMYTKEQVSVHHFPEITDAVSTEALINRPFGLNAQGRIDFAAGNKVGQVSGCKASTSSPAIVGDGTGGIVTWWR